MVLRAMWPVTLTWVTLTRVTLSRHTHRLMELITWCHMHLVVFMNRLTLMVVAGYMETLPIWRLYRSTGADSGYYSQ